MNQSNLENNRFITASLFILALVAVAFTLSFTKPIMIPFVMALLIRILIDPIIDLNLNNSINSIDELYKKTKFEFQRTNYRSSISQFKNNWRWREYRLYQAKIIQ